MARSPGHVRSSTFFALTALAVGVPCLAAAQSTRATVWPDEGPATWAPRPTEPAITANDLRTHVYQLAADSMMGRAAVERGNWMATAYVASVFERLGLQPAGEDGYFQELLYGPIYFDRDAIRLVVDGRRLEPVTDWAPYPATQQAGISGTFEGERVATVFGGYWNGGATVLSADDVRGRVAVFDVPDAQTARQRGLSLGLQLNDSPIQSAGPAAILLVLPGLLNPNSLQEGFGLFTPVSGTPVALVSRDVANAFFERPLSEVEVGATGRPVTASWDYAYRRPEYPARNVIALLPGSDPALRGQYVLVGAHNDHNGMLPAPGVDHDSLRAYNRVMRPQGLNDERNFPDLRPTAAQQARIDSLIAYARSIRPRRMDNVMNGADDDASGTGILLEIAERFATEPAPARSILFISHTAEESGLLGSGWFVDHPTVPLDSIVAAHNMDMVGKGRVTDVRFGGPAQVQMLGARRLSSDFGDVIDSLNAVREETMAIDYSWDRTNALNRFCRSDQLNYFRRGIPVTYFSTGYSADYHYATDEPQYIDYEKSGRVGRFVHEIMRTIANRPTRLRVLPPDERDFSAQCR